MADTDKISPPGNIQLNDILGISNTNGRMTLDLSNNDDLSDFGTPLHTLEDKKTPNIVQNGEIAAATATEPRTSRILFTEEAKDNNETGPKLTTIREVNKTPDQLLPQPDLGATRFGHQPPREKFSSYHFTPRAAF
jgi:hypothetical protein